MQHVLLARSINSGFVVCYFSPQSRTETMHAALSQQSVTVSLPGLRVYPSVSEFVQCLWQCQAEGQGCLPDSESPDTEVDVWCDGEGIGPRDEVGEASLSHCGCPWP